MDKVRIKKYIPVIFLILISIAWTLCYYWHEYDGDDLSFMLLFRNVDGLDKFYEWPWLIIKHWVLSNGRLADKLFVIPMLALFPKLVNALICGIFFFLMNFFAYLDITHGGRSKGTTLVFITIIFALAFPWWYEGYQLAVCINYVATSAMLLIAIYLWNHESILSRFQFLCCLFFVMTGMMHEGSSIPVVMASLLVLYIKKRRMESFDITPIKRKAAISFLAGTAVVSLSPGIWLRFFSVQTGRRMHFDGSLGELIITTLPLLVLLLVLLIILAVLPTRTVYIRSLFAKDRFLFWVSAAIFGSLFVFAGRLQGNTGWFAELFSLCALAELFNDAGGKKTRGFKLIFTILFGIFVLWNSFYVTLHQQQNSAHIRKIRQMYSETLDEAVFYDLPASPNDKWLFGRIHSIDNKDFYTMTMVSRYYGKDQIVVLPTSMKNLNLDKTLALPPHSFLKAGNGLSLSSTLPEGAEKGVHWTNSEFWILKDNDQNEYRVFKFLVHKKYYYAIIIDD